MSQRGPPTLRASGPLCRGDLETGVLRFSPKFFNTADEMHVAAEAVRTIVGG